MGALATIADVEALTFRTVGDDDVDKINRLLTMVSNRVRRYTRQTLDYVEDDILDVTPNWSNEIELPQRPVISVASVAINGTEIVDSLWKVTPRGNLYRYGFMWGGPNDIITVTYTHGYDPVPDDIVEVIAAVVAERWVAAKANPDGVKQETIGGYSVTYDSDDSDMGIVFTDDQKKTLRSYRRTFTSVAIGTLPWPSTTF